MSLYFPSASIFSRALMKATISGRFNVDWPNVCTSTRSEAWSNRSKQFVICDQPAIVRSSPGVKPSTDLGGGTAAARATGRCANEGAVPATRHRNTATAATTDRRLIIPVSFARIDGRDHSNRENYGRGV